MYQLLVRFAWTLSVLVGTVFGLFVSGFDGYHVSESFIEFGWIFAAVATFVVKWKLFPAKTLDEAYDTLSSRASGVPADSAFYRSAITEAGADPVQTPHEPAISASVLPSDDGIPQSDSTSWHVPTESLPDVPAAAPVDILPEVEEDATPNKLVLFFSDRPLAKIGGILLFLGAMFFLSLVWSILGPVGKTLIGIAFGFSLYGVGVFLDRKGSVIESRTLMWVGIAVNALTILSGRWLFQNATLAPLDPALASLGVSTPFLSDSLTFFFLVLNTAFAVATGLAYSSQTFLTFSFVFGYFIPFIVGWKAETPYVLLGYNALLTVSAYALAYRLDREKSVWLVRTGATGFFALAFFNAFAVSGTAQSAVYLLTAFAVCAYGLWVDAKRFDSEYFLPLAASAYASVFFLLFQDAPLPMLILGIVPVFALVSWKLLTATAGTVLMPLQTLLLVPILFAFLALGFHGFSAITIVLVPILLLYGAGMFFLFAVVPVFFQYVLLVGLGWFLAACAFSTAVTPIVATGSERALIAASVVAFFSMFSFVSIRKQAGRMIEMTFVLSVVALASVLHRNWEFSWLVLAIFSAVVLVVPFFAAKSSDQSESSMAPSLLTLLSLFAVGETTYLGWNVWYDPANGTLVTLGYVYLAFAAFATAYSLIFAPFMARASYDGMSQLRESQKNMLYALFAVPLSLFSLSIAVLFAKTPSVVASVWVLEAMILAYLYGKTRNRNVLIWAVALSFIGMLRLLPFLDSVRPGDYFSLVPLSLITIALLLSVRSIGKRESSLAFAFDFVHVATVLVVASVVKEIIPSLQYGFGVLSVGVFLVILAFSYRGTNSAYLRAGYGLLLVFFFFDAADRAQRVSSIAEIAVQGTGIAFAAFSAYLVFRDSFKTLRVPAVSFASVATLYVTSAYVASYFDNAFAVTIYLALVATALIVIGIDRNYRPFRTAGLYVGSVVLAKILFFDVWYGLDDAAIRVLALMVTGWIMIWLSQVYGKSIKRDWSEEFSLANFSGTLPSTRDGACGTDSNEDASAKPSVDEGSPAPDLPIFDATLGAELDRIDISGYSSAVFTRTDGTSFSVRTKPTLRLVSYVLDRMKKDSFEPNELMGLYGKIMEHVLLDSLRKESVDTQESLRSWIVSGWSVRFVRK